MFKSIATYQVYTMDYSISSIAGSGYWRRMPITQFSASHSLTFIWHWELLSPVAARHVECRIDLVKLLSTHDPVFCKGYHHTNEENEIRCHCLSYEMQTVLIRVTDKFKDTVNKIKSFQYFDRVLTALEMLLMLSSSLSFWNTLRLRRYSVGRNNCSKRKLKASLSLYLFTKLSLILQQAFFKFWSRKNVHLPEWGDSVTGSQLLKSLKLQQLK
jgi:hypothetical protein